MFKVGDIIRGTHKSDEYYSITSSEMTKGVVEWADYNNNLMIRILEHKNEFYIGKQQTALNGNLPGRFELVRPNVKRKRNLRPIPMK